MNSEELLKRNVKNLLRSALFFLSSSICIRSASNLSSINLVSCSNVNETLPRKKEGLKNEMYTRKERTEQTF